MLRVALIASLLLGAIEGLAWWWMHPAPTDSHQPLLVYQPQVGRDPARSAHLSPPAGEANAPAQSSTDNRQPTTDNSSSTNPKSKINNHPSSISPSSHSKSSSNLQTLGASTTPLPDLYTRSAPMLRCTGGQVFLTNLDDDISVHCAFFEWDGTDTGSVLEAFRHMPEACMGSIGMKLVSKEKPIPYTIGLDRRAAPLFANGGESEGNAEVKGQKSKVSQRRKPEPPRKALLRLPTFDLRLSTLPLPSIQNSKFATTSLLFDHTIFRDPTHTALPGSLVHAFRAVWVAGLPDANPRAGLAGHSLENLRSIRLRSALHRYRPAHARVIQGAVRGTLNTEAAWQAFQSAILHDLRMK